MGVSLARGRHIKDDGSAFDLRIWINSSVLRKDREEWSGFGGKDHLSGLMCTESDMPVRAPRRNIE